MAQKKYWLGDAVKSLSDDVSEKEFVFINADNNTQERHDLTWFDDSNGFDEEEVKEVAALKYGESALFGMEGHIVVRVR